MTIDWSKISLLESKPVHGWDMRCYIRSLIVTMTRIAWMIMEMNMEGEMKNGNDVVEQ